MARPASASQGRGSSTLEASSEFELADNNGYKEPFSTPHTVTVLFLVVAFVMYVLFQRNDGNEESNFKIGLVMAILVGLVSVHSWMPVGDKLLMYSSFRL
jgi:hypothetical protein